MRLRVHIGGVELAIVSTLFLRPVQCRARVPENRGVVFAIERKDSDPDAGRNIDFLPPQLKRRFERVRDRKRNVGQFSGCFGLGQQQSKLVTIRSPCRVAFAHTIPQSGRSLGQHDIARLRGVPADFTSADRDILDLLQVEEAVLHVGDAEVRRWVFPSLMFWRALAPQLQLPDCLNR